MIDAADVSAPAQAEELITRNAQLSIPSLAKVTLADEAKARRSSIIIDCIKQAMPRIEELVQLSGALPGKYSEIAFGEFLRLLLESEREINGMVKSPAASLKTGAAEFDGASMQEKTLGVSLHSVEEALGVPLGSLARVLQIDEDKTVHVLARIEGKSVKDRQLRLAQILCFVREKAFNEMKTDIEEIRALCVDQGVYDPANFAANLRRDPSVNAATTPGSKEKFVVLSREGVEAATDLLRDLAGA